MEATNSKRISRIILRYISFILFILLLGLFVFGYYFIRPLTPHSGKMNLTINQIDPEINFSGQQMNIQVYRDKWGIPYINCPKEHFAWFALGWVHAQDRLWQMEILRHGARGNLSLLFGEKLINTDQFLLTLGFLRNGKNSLQYLNKNEKKILEYYINGINAYIKKYPEKLPPELKLIPYKKSLWQMADPLAIIRYLEWQKESSLRKEILLEHIRNLLKTRKSVPDLLNRILEILKSPTLAMPNKDEKDKIPVNGSIPGLIHQNSGLLISGRKNKKQTAWMAADYYGNVKRLHETGYFASLKAESLQVEGLTMPGIPVFFMGRNQNISWSFSSVNSSSIKLVPLKIQNTPLRSYFLDNQWTIFNIITETLLYFKEGTNKFIKDTSNVYQSYFGPLITQAFNGLPEMLKFRKDYALYWTGFLPVREFSTYLGILRVGNWLDFLKALDQGHVANEIAYYADRQGNIGAKLIGKYPKQADFFDVKNIRPLENNSVHSQIDFIPFDDLPQIYNPEKGYLTSFDLFADAPRKHTSQNGSENNAANGNENSAIGKNIGAEVNLNLNLARIQLQQLIDQTQMDNPQVLESIQNETFSLWAKEFRDQILPYLDIPITPIDPNNPQMNVILLYANNFTSSFKSQIEHLRSWDGSFQKNYIAPSIIYMFQLALIRNILYDKIGEFLTDELLKIDGFPESILDAIVKEGKKNPESLWFDQFKTRKIAETFSQLIGLSYYDAIFFLNRRQGPHLKDWIWGNNHKLFLHHPFEKSLLGKYIFPKGPFAVAGFSTSIFSTASLPFNEREISLAPSARIIHTGWDDPLKINLVSGQSGISSSKHYFDLGNLWLNGEYTKMEKNQESMTQKNLKLLRLKVHIK